MTLTTHPHVARTLE